MSSNSAPRCVLDSFALLAFLQSEDRTSLVSDVLAQAARGQAELLMCLANLGEVLYIVERKRGLMAAHGVIAAVEQLPIHIVQPDRALTFGAAHIKAHHAVSFADAFAVALAQQENARVITGDPELRRVQALVDISWL